MLDSFLVQLMFCHSPQHRTWMVPLHRLASDCHRAIADFLCSHVFTNWNNPQFPTVCPGPCMSQVPSGIPLMLHWLLCLPMPMVPVWSMIHWLVDSPWPGGVVGWPVSTGHLAYHFLVFWGKVQVYRWLWGWPILSRGQPQGLHLGLVCIASNWFSSLTLLSISIFPSDTTTYAHCQLVTWGWNCSEKQYLNIYHLLPLCGCHRGRNFSSSHSWFCLSGRVTSSQNSHSYLAAVFTVLYCSHIPPYLICWSTINRIRSEITKLKFTISLVSQKCTGMHPKQWSTGKGFLLWYLI